MSTTLANLPSFHTTFLGRERELDELLALLRLPDARLVTIVGVGGVGKTRLAVEAARRLEMETGRRLAFISLAATSSDHQITDLVARSIGLVFGDGQDPTRIIATAVEERPVLFILDNFEHMLEQAVTIGRLLSSSPGLQILVTSRSPLDIRGEHVYQLNPFSIPADVDRLNVSELRALEAVRLFEERARAVQHDFQISPLNAAAVAAICQRLDGLPLAVELAAARSRMLAPAVLLARLDRPLEALKSGPLDSPDRHRSLRAALDWSFGLLSPEEQRLFQRLGAPRVSFSIAAIEALSEGIDIDPLEGISSLVSKSLVQPSNTLRSDGSESVRFQMLVTVREFALEKLAASDEFVHAHDLFARHIGDMAAAVAPEFPLGPAAGDASFDITGVDREPALAALDWLHRSDQHGQLLHLVGLLAPHWFARGALRDAHACLQIALSLDTERDPGDLARATVAMGMVAIQQGNFEYGEQRLKVGLEMATDAGSDTWIGQANFSMGVVKQDQGRPEEAIRYFEAAHQTFQMTDQTVFANIAQNNLGLVTARARDLREGLAIIEGSRQNHRQLGFDFGVALAERYSGQILLELGELQLARTMLISSLQLEPEQMQGWHLANSIETIAQVEAREGQYSQAAVLAAGARQLREEIGVPLEPALREWWENFEADLVDHLDPVALENATQEGRNLTPAQLIRRATASAQADQPQQFGDDAPSRQAKEKPGEASSLTPREMEVLELLVAGRTNPDIGEELFISPRTVSVHVTHILEKLDVENRSAAVALALRSGMVQPRD
jgi:predicted ATPase/DNA-binding CsgD family transcriptional regulator